MGVSGAAELHRPAKAQRRTSAIGQDESPGFMAAYSRVIRCGLMRLFTFLLAFLPEVVTQPFSMLRCACFGMSTKPRRHGRCLSRNSLAPFALNRHQRLDVC